MVVPRARIYSWILYASQIDQRGCPPGGRIVTPCYLPFPQADYLLVGEDVC